MDRTLAYICFRLLYRLREKSSGVLGRAMNATLRSSLHSSGWADLTVTDTLACDSGPRNAESRFAPNELEIVVVTYRQPDALRCLLGSLACQSLQNFRVRVMHDGPDAPTREVVDAYAQDKPGVFQYDESSQRHNDYGHSLRAKAIEELDADYVLITNGDNYYSPRLVEMAFELLHRDKLDMVIWDMVHSHTNPGKSVAASYEPFSVFPIRNFIDVGSFIVRSDLARNAGFNDRTHDGDASYFEHIVSKAGRRLKIGKIEKVLMMHN